MLEDVSDHGNVRSKIATSTMAVIRETSSDNERLFVWLGDLRARFRKAWQPELLVIVTATD